MIRLFPKYIYLIFIFVFFSLVQPYPAEAQQPLPRDSGFSGYLDRDEYRYRLTAQYAFRLASRMRLLPILRYVRGDADGDANSFHGLAPQLSLQYFGNRLQVALNASVNREWYDKSHPVFNETRKDYNLGLFAILGYKDPFGWNNFRIDWFNGAFRQNSNIDFFESSSYLSALGIGYTF